MTENERIEAKVRQAFTHATPDVLDAVLSDCEKQKGKTIMMTENKKKKRNARRFASIAAALLLVLGLSVSLGLYRADRAVASTVSLDVNPSIELQCNSKEKVVAAKALNEDGAEILDDMDLKGSSLDVAVNAIVGSMLREGYLSDLANSILVSVEGKDSDAIQQRIAEEIDEILSGGGIEAAVLSQSLTEDSELTALAEQYGITEGKANLIREIITLNPNHKFEQLSGLTVNELNILLGTAKKASAEITPVKTPVSTTGTASEKGYIGLEKAIAAACKHAGIRTDDARYCTGELDYEDGMMVYEIEFVSGGYEYEYEINAKTGAVVKYERELDNEHRSSTGTSTGTSTGASTSSSISSDKAVSIALADAGVKSSDAKNLTVHSDYDDGVKVYEVEFNANGYEYDYTIKASNGAILERDRERDSSTGFGTSTGTTPDYIGRDAAKSAALKYAGIAAGDTYDWEIDLDTEDSPAVYEVEFKSGNYEYSCDVDALTGTVSHFEKELID